MITTVYRIYTFIRKSKYVRWFGLLLSIIILSVFAKRYTWPRIKKTFSIEKVYVINLDKSKDRWDKIHNDLTKAGVQHERFPAIDGLTLKFNDEYGNTFTGADLKSGKVKIKVNDRLKVFCPNVILHYVYDFSELRRPLSAGEFGCFCSHMEVMHLISQSTNSNAISVVLEDDALIPSDFKQKLSTLSSNLISIKDWDWIQLFQKRRMSRRYIKSLPILGTHIRSISRNTNRTHAYAVHRNGAAKVMGAGRRVYTTIDDQLLYDNSQKLIILESDMNIDQLSSPVFTKIKGSNSTIW